MADLPWERMGCGRAAVGVGKWLALSWRPCAWVQVWLRHKHIRGNISSRLLLLYYSLELDSQSIGLSEHNYYLMPQCNITHSHTHIFTYTLSHTHTISHILTITTTTIDANATQTKYIHQSGRRRGERRGGRRGGEGGGGEGGGEGAAVHAADPAAATAAAAAAVEDDVVARAVRGGAAPTQTLAPRSG